MNTLDGILKTPFYEVVILFQTKTKHFMQTEKSAVTTQIRMRYTTAMTVDCSHFEIESKKLHTNNDDSSSF